jgi:hypothetical protein
VSNKPPLCLSTMSLEYQCAADSMINMIVNLEGYSPPTLSELLRYRSMPKIPRFGFEPSFWRAPSRKTGTLHQKIQSRSSDHRLHLSSAPPCVPSDPSKSFFDRPHTRHTTHATWLSTTPRRPTSRLRYTSNPARQEQVQVPY